MHATSAHRLPTAQIVGICDIKKDPADRAAENQNFPAVCEYIDLAVKQSLSQLR